MLNISSTAKLVTLVMASFMLASSTSAAPVLNLHSGGDSLLAVDCHGADQKEYSLAINIQPNTLATLNAGKIALTTTDSPKYHIQVDATSKSGTERLTGRAASFNIAATTFFQKRNDDITLPVDGSAIPEVVSPISGVAAPVPIDESKAKKLFFQSQQLQHRRPRQLPGAPAPPVNPAITTAPVPLAVPETSVATSAPSVTPSPSPSPSPAVIPTPTYPNTSLEIIDPSTLVNPSGPNQAAPGDPAAPKVIPEPKKQPTSAEVFFKYAGAGSAILSTIGFGVGGLVGGVVGGTVGLLIGLLAALVTSLYYAPNTRLRSRTSKTLIYSIRNL
ncbi:hypothetical protein BGZ47_009235 [Haplosporangium gracile]|nr:hypothetical protein BGZ47_009235 [Haplosporangium gracile]